MHLLKMKIHKEGYKSILIAFLALTILVVSVVLLLPIPIWFEFVLYFLGALTFIGIILFFRVPVRTADYADDKIFSAADGKVVAIEEVEEPEYFQGRRLQVSVFMSVANVHVNLAPLGGVVKYFRYHPGKHLIAWLPKSSTDNERTTLVIENSIIGDVLIRQIAGAFARRIVCYPREGDHVNQGAEIGIIKFGSRVDILLPLHAWIKVELNQQVKGGETLLATIK
jgi:phosphatidylserine decarboxylase